MHLVSGRLLARCVCLTCSILIIENGAVVSAYSFLVDLASKEKYGHSVEPSHITCGNSENYTFRVQILEGNSGYGPVTTSQLLFDLHTSPRTPRTTHETNYDKYGAMTSNFRQSASCVSDGSQPPRLNTVTKSRRRISPPPARTVRDMSFSPRYRHEGLVTLRRMTMRKTHLGQLFALKILEEVHYLRDSEKALQTRMNRIETSVCGSTQSPGEGRNEDDEHDVTDVAIGTGVITSPSLHHHETLCALRQMTKGKYFYATSTSCA